MLAAPIVLGGLVGCAGESSGRQARVPAQSCMTCHNGSQDNDYSGPGLEDPHPFGAASLLTCTTCHGGNPLGEDELASHVPPPPEIGDRANQAVNRTAYFNRLTLTGIDKFPDYVVDGVTYTALDYLQFVNPGDLRVVTLGRSCGACHAPHSQSVANSLLATEAGVLSGAMFAAGVDNQVPQNQGLYEDTAADLAFRARTDPLHAPLAAGVGEVGQLIEHPVHSVFGVTGPDQLFQNQNYDAAGLSNDLHPDGRVIAGSNLANLYQEQVAFTCGDCHLGSAGANNRYGDFRSSGCTACHMPYSLSGRSTSNDPNVNKLEPADPDDIEEPERAHVRRHRIASVHKTLPSGVQVEGIDDYACAGCHQGSNRTVMQFWGIRLDQNQDLRRGVQYPANPVSYRNTNGDTRLFDPAVGNNTFNGRNRNQYIVFEDYDGDGRDDTPEDVHYAAGMGCIDCHGSYDLHGGNTTDTKLLSRMSQSVAITCESCHGAADALAPTTPGLDYAGQLANLAMDSKGNPLRHVARDANGDMYLTSRLTGNVHYVSQTLDTVVDSGRTHPVTGSPIYSAKASYAMGRADGNAATGTGPLQTGMAAGGFAHGDSMSCASCHAAWTNTCIGCHLEGEYNTNNNNFSNITGQRIVFREDEADFVYQNPLHFQLGIAADNQIEPITPNSDAFFQYEDLNNQRSETFAFSDRTGSGNNRITTAFPSMSHNAMMPHSIRGKVDPLNEGPRYCTACHLTDNGLTLFGTEYDAFRTAMAGNDFASLDFPLLQNHFGRNPNNQLDSPLWVHMVAGLGSGLYLFDDEGCPVNPLDGDANRKGCDNGSPAANYDPADATLNLDRIVDSSGVATGSNNHPLMAPGQGPNLRTGATDPNMAGPLGATLIQRLTDPVLGIVLDSWIDANGALQGDASTHVGGP
jgi:hypothetical protein